MRVHARFTAAAVFCISSPLWFFETRKLVARARRKTRACRMNTAMCGAVFARVCLEVALFRPAGIT